MDPAEYKSICARADVIRRSDLGDTAEALRRVRSPDADLVEEMLEQPPVEKPALHAVGPEADFFYVTLDLDAIDSIVEQLRDAQAAAIGPRGEMTSEASRLADLTDIWTRCQEWMENGGAA